MNDLKWDINWTKSCADIIAHSNFCGDNLLEALSVVCHRGCDPKSVAQLSKAYEILAQRLGFESKPMSSPTLLLTFLSIIFRIDGQGSQVGGQGDQGRGQRNGRNQNDDAVNDNIRGDVSRGCTYKKFLACNPKEYDGKGGAIVYTYWIGKIDSVQDMSGCRDS
nr:reverse transcriptase domain-containing protein [Tanacetum cinerariifolium]